MCLTERAARDKLTQPTDVHTTTVMQLPVPPGAQRPPSHTWFHCEVPDKLLSQKQEEHFPQNNPGSFPSALSSPWLLSPNGPDAGPPGRGSYGLD